MSAKQAYRMPYSGRDVPHAVIEVNQKCNISCAACYKSKNNYTKPLEQVKQEVDLVTSLRNLNLVTLAGGEPTLHPDLPEIIRYIAAKGPLVQMLSNGYQLDGAQLDAYREAGLHGIFLHIDSMQRRPDAPGQRSERDLNALRQTIARRVRRHGLYCFLECTLYQQNLPELPEIVEFVLSTPECSRLLVTCFTDLATAASRLKRGEILGSPVTPWVAPKPGATPEDSSRNAVDNAEVERLLARTLGMRPFAYLASNTRATEQRWIFYYSFVINLPGGERKVLHAPPSFGKLVELVYARTKKQGKAYSFGDIPDAARSVQMLLAHAVISLDPQVLLETMAFLAHLLKRGARLHHKSFNFQQGPNATPDGELEYCQDCPDATVRNGRLVPVCMVDLLSPLERAPAER